MAEPAAERCDVEDAFGGFVVRCGDAAGILRARRKRAAWGGKMNPAADGRAQARMAPPRHSTDLREPFEGGLRTGKFRLS